MNETSKKFNQPDESNVILLNYTGRNGGGPLDSYELAKALLECGEKVIAIISSNCSNLKYWKTLPLEKLILVDTYSNKRELIYRTIYFWIYNRWKIFIALRDYKIEFILCPMITLWTSMINLTFSYAPICIINHDPKPHSGDKSIVLLNLFGMQRVYRTAKIIFVHSERFINYVEQTYRKQGKVFYIPLGRHSFYKNISNKKVSVQYKANKINFLFFGRIEKYKGLDILAEAYKIVSSECNNVTLTIAGSGHFETYEVLYRNLPNVTLEIRWIDDSEVESFFNGPNVVLVVPYTEATQSGPILIALDYSVPVIASDVGGLKEQIVEGRTGILVKPASSKDLAQAMIRIAQDSNVIKTLTAGGQTKLKELDWNTIAKKLCEITRKNLIDN